METFDATFEALNARANEPFDATFEALQAPPERVDPTRNGYTKLTVGDWAVIDSIATDTRTLGDVGAEYDFLGGKDTPFFGAAVRLRDLYQLTRDTAAMISGEADRDAQMRVAAARARSLQDSTFAAKVGGILGSMATTGVEFGLTAGAGSAMKLGASASLKVAKGEVLDELASRARESAVSAVVKKIPPKLLAGASTAVGVTAAQEAVPRVFGMGGGAWTLAASQRAFADWKPDVEEAKHVAALANEGMAEFVNAKHPLWKGMVEKLIENGFEQSGSGIARLPGFSYLAAIQTKALGKVAGGAAGREGMDKLAEFARKGFAYDGPLQEVLEEVIGGMAVEAWGQQDASAFVDGLPKDIEELAALFVATLIPGLGGAAIVRTRNAVRSQKRAELRGEDQQSNGDEQAPEQRKEETPAGGDAISPGEATVESSVVEPGVSSEPESVAAFAVAAELQDAQHVEPGDEREAAAAQLAVNFGREIILVSGKGKPRQSGMIDEQGRMFVHAETASPLAVAVHELGHKVADTLGPDRFRSEVAKIEEVAPGFVARYTEQWRRRAERADPGSSGVDPDTELQEGFATLAEEHAALIAHATTEQGAADLEIVARQAPTLFRSIVDAVKDLFGRLPKDSLRAARQRIESITGTAPDQQAAQLSQALSDLYTRTLNPEAKQEAQGATDAVRARSGADSSPQPEDGTAALLGELQQEADRLGVARVRIVPRGPGADPALREPTPGPSLEPSPRTQSDSGDGVVEAPPRDEYASGSRPPRPDRNNPLVTAEGRAALDAVDRGRNEQGLPEVMPRADSMRTARERLREDYSGTRIEIEKKLAAGDQLSSWETHAVVDIMDGLSLEALRGVPGAMGDFVEIGEAYRAVRGETARALATIAGRGRPGADGKSAREMVLDMLSVPTRANRRKLREIEREAGDIIRRVGKFKGDKARFLTTRFQREYTERTSRRFAPTSDLRFAPNDFNDRGQPISEERLEHLAEQKEKIKADEAKRMERAAEALQRAGFDPSDMSAERMLDPNDGWKIKNIISAAKATKTEKLLEYRYASMLSGVRTHVRNMTGNGVQLFLEGPAQKGAEALVNLAIKDPNSPAGSELAWWSRGFFAHLRPAFRNLVNAYRTEGPTWELDLQRKGVEMGEYGSRLDAIHGVKSANPMMKALRHLSLNTLQAGDEFIKTLSGGAEAWSLAFRNAHNEKLRGKEREVRAMEMLADANDPLWTQSLYKARAVTFQDEGGVASQKANEILNKFVGSLDELGENTVRIPIGTLLIPFRRTPIRIAATALRRTPLQSLVLPSRWINGVYKGDRNALVRDLADAMIAWGLTLAVLELVDKEDEDGLPFITGSRSDSSGENALSYRTAPPMSIRVGDEYRDYSSVEPFSTSVAMLIAGATKFKETGDIEVFQALLAAAASQTKDKTFMRTIGDLMELADGQRVGKDRFPAFLRSTLVTPMVPNAIRQVARESDDVLRERRTSDQGKLAFWTDGIMSTSADPIARLTGAEPKRPKYDLWGRVIERPHVRHQATDLVFRLLDPLPPRQSLDEVSRIDIALRRWRQKVDTGEVTEGRYSLPGRPATGFSIDGVKYTMTPSEYERYARDSGQAASASILGNTSIKLDDPSQKDHDAIHKAIRSARSAVLKEIKAERRSLASTR